MADSEPPSYATTLVKYLMCIFNFVFCLSGLALMAVGIFTQLKYGIYFSYADDKFGRAEYLIIAVGVIVFVVGFFGCCGVAKGSRWMIMTFLVLLIILIVMEITAAILGYVYRTQVKDVASDALKRGVINYSSESGAKHVMDWTQQTFSCCGYSGPEDYTNQTKTCGIEKGAPSCHQGGTCKGQLNDIGCTQQFIAFVKKNLGVIGACSVGVASIQVLAVVFSCLLVKTHRREYETI